MPWAYIQIKDKFDGPIFGWGGGGGGYIPPPETREEVNQFTLQPVKRFFQ